MAWPKGKPREPRAPKESRWAEIIKQASAFNKLINSAERALGQTFGLDDRATLNALHEALSEAYGGLGHALKRVAPQIEALNREAEMAAKLEAQAAEIERLNEALRISGHSDKLTPDQAQFAAGMDHLRKRGRPAKNQQPEIAA